MPEDGAFTIFLQCSDWRDAIISHRSAHENLGNYHLLHRTMVKGKPLMSLRQLPIGATERRIVCQGCGEQGAAFSYEDGTSFHLTGLFYFHKRKGQDGSSVIACGRCQQIYLGHDETKVTHSVALLDEQNRGMRNSTGASAFSISLWGARLPK